MITAAERIVLRIAAEEAGFVSERDLNRTQIKVARALVVRGMLRRAGAEPDSTAVYGITDQGRAKLMERVG